MQRVLTVVLGMFLLSGCTTVALKPFTQVENQERVTQDLKALFANQEVITGPIRLEDAIARALAYNLDHRLKLMERAVGLQQLDVARSALLPTVAANAGYDARSRADTTFNQTRTATSTTSDKQVKTGDLSVTWNVLDFGIGYIRARQQADLALIVEERRRQVIHNIIQDSRAAYWRAVASERALRKLEPLTERVQEALAQAEAQVQAQVNMMQAMVYERTLLETLRQLEALRRDMVAAHSELAVLMNVHPDSPFTLVDAATDAAPPEVAIDFDFDKLELAALTNRSELRSEAYQHRVFQEEARIALLEMIPGLSFSAGLNYTSDRFKANDRWYNAGLDLTWNVISLFQGPEKVALAESQQKLSQVRRLALSMAVIAQVNVAGLRFQAATKDYKLASRIAGIEQRIQVETANGFAANTRSERDVIEADVRSALAALRRDLAYADLQDGFGRLVATTGSDPAIEEDATKGGLAGLSDAVAEALRAWSKGEFKAPLREQAAASEDRWLF